MNGRLALLLLRKLATILLHIVTAQEQLTMALLPLLSALLLALPFCFGADPALPYPEIDTYLPTTSILDHASYVEGYADSNWLLANIPFVDLPDKSIQDVYYYRTSVVKRCVWVPITYTSKLRESGI